MYERAAGVSSDGGVNDDDGTGRHQQRRHANTTTVASVLNTTNDCVHARFPMESQHRPQRGGSVPREDRQPADGGSLPRQQAPGRRAAGNSCKMIVHQSPSGTETMAKTTTTRETRPWAPAWGGLTRNQRGGWLCKRHSTAQAVTQAREDVLCCPYRTPSIQLYSSTDGCTP